MEFSLENRSGIRANFAAADQTAQDTIRRIVFEHGEFCLELLRFFVPVDKGNMYELAKTVYSEGGLIFETGWEASDFFDRELTFYPPYVEDGTRLMAAQPSLRPAYAETVKTLVPEISAELRLALERKRYHL